MRLVDSIERLARGEAPPAEARSIIRDAVDSGETARAYGAICRWTWRTLIEGRLDPDLRQWHRLILDAAGWFEAKIEEDVNRSPEAGATPPARVAPEHLKALGDILRL